MVYVGCSVFVQSSPSTIPKGKLHVLPAYSVCVGSLQTHSNSPTEAHSASMSARLRQKKIHALLSLFKHEFSQLLRYIQLVRDRFKASFGTRSSSQKILSKKWYDDDIQISYSHKMVRIGYKNTKGLFHISLNEEFGLLMLSFC